MPPMYPRGITTHAGWLRRRVHPPMRSASRPLLLGQRPPRRLGVSRARVRHLLDVGRVSEAGRALALADKSRSVAAGEIYRIDGALQAESETPTPRPETRPDS